MMKNKCSIGKVGLLALLLTVGVGSAQAQEVEGVTPQGKPIIVLFADYTAGLTDANDVAGFNLTRSRLGYEYRPIQPLKATVVLDINASGNERIVNFQYAMLEWEYEKLTLGGGLIALSQFGVQEAFWGKRYIQKSYQDLYGFGFDSDLGLIAKYQFTNWLSADVAVTNGEGTMNLNNNNSNKYSAGITLRPVEGLTLRAYADTYAKSSDLYLPVAPGETPTYKNQQTVALFAGYSNKLFSIGAEYNNQMNRGFIDGCDYSGYSVYAGAPLGAKAAVYARYDHVDTDTPTGITYNWSQIVNKDGLIAGFEYRPISQLSVSPNYRYLKPLEGDGQHFIALNVGFSW